jgi:hypothetical protein
MVWIYGGALVHGRTSLYPADALARQGIIVVSMNYRMGRFGFFAHPALAKEAPDDISGNYGYMDQRAALQWVQRKHGHQDRVEVTAATLGFAGIADPSRGWPCAFRVSIALISSSGTASAG